MKRYFFLLLTALLAAALLVPAMAEVGNGSLGDMEVVNCEEWVSLRAQPDTGSARLAKVPLGAVVTDCFAWDARFVFCRYDGLEGYILGEYLESVSDDASGRLALDETRNGVRVTARRTYGEGETLAIQAVNEAGYPLWDYTASSAYTTELDLTDAFLGGTAEDPRVIVYGEDGLASLRLKTGEKVWQLPVSLGGSLTHAVAEDGTMYIGGYYGPNIIAFDRDGLILWHAEENSDLFWLYEIQLTDEGILATYDHIPGDTAGTVCYDYDGRTLWTK